MNTETIPDIGAGSPTSRPAPLRRPFHGRLLTGAAAGIAEYLDVDVLLVRIAITVLALVGGVGIPLYLAAWLLIPEEGSDEPVAADILRDLRFH